MKYLELAPFAISSDGVLFINATITTKATDLEAVVRAVAREKRAVFVGIALTPEESEFATARLDNAADEAAMRIAAQRRASQNDKSDDRK